MVDTNILLGQMLGRRSEALFLAIVTARTVVMTARTAAEMHGVLRGRTARIPRADAQPRELPVQLPIIPERIYLGRLAAAREVLRDAVASRNGSTGDAHLLACGWVLDADLWTHDRDLAGTGWPSWSNANLVRALEAPQLR